MEKDNLLQMALQTLQIIVKDSGGGIAIDKQLYKDLLGKPVNLTIDTNDPELVKIELKEEIEEKKAGTIII